MPKHTTETTVCIPIDDSNWKIKLSRYGKRRIIIALHWGDKIDPTHLDVMSVREFTKISNTLIA